MKYVAIIDSDNELSEDTIKFLKNSVYVGNEQTPYCFDITSIKKTPHPKPKCDGADDFNDFARYYEGYNQALRDCGVLEE